MELKKLNWTTFIVVFMVLGTGIFILFQVPYVRSWYWVQRFKEPVNQHYKIQTKLVEMKHASLKYSVQPTLIISEVDDNGMGKKLGFKKDDLVFSSYHYSPMSEAYFYRHMASGYFPYQRLIVVNKEEYLQCGKKWPDPEKFRELDFKTSSVPMAKENAILDKIFEVE
jgi:hypothetical protein